MAGGLALRPSQEAPSSATKRGLRLDRSRSVRRGPLGDLSALAPCDRALHCPRRSRHRHERTERTRSQRGPWRDRPSRRCASTGDPGTQGRRPLSRCAIRNRCVDQRLARRRGDQGPSSQIDASPPASVRRSAGVTRIGSGGGRGSLRSLDGGVCERSTTAQHALACTACDGTARRPAGRTTGPRSARRTNRHLAEPATTHVQGTGRPSDQPIRPLDASPHGAPSCARRRKHDRVCASGGLLGRRTFHANLPADVRAPPDGVHPGRHGVRRPVTAARFQPFHSSQRRPVCLGCRHDQPRLYP